MEMFGAFGVIAFVNAKVPPETLRLPRMFNVKDAEPVKRKEPLFVAKTLKLPAMMAPFNPPSKFNAPVCEGQFQVKFPKFCDKPPVALTLVV